jgi:hypothetical protein
MEIRRKTYKEHRSSELERENDELVLTLISAISNFPLPLLPVI